MATQIQTWQIVDGKLAAVKSSMIEEKKKEKDDLEAWIKTNPQIIGTDIFIIGEQIRTKSGPLDFLGIDNNGNVVVIELKRDKLAREVLAQALDYASDVAFWEVERFRDICLKFHNRTLEDYLGEKLGEGNIDDLSINQAVRILLVGFSVDESLGRMIEWLSSTYNVGINAIVLNYIKTSGGDELLSRTVIVPEEIEKEKAKSKKFIIEMSSEPGQYSNEDLRDQLHKYFSKNLYSAQRIKEHVIPILLENKIITRNQLKKEFIVRKAAPDESQAGYFLSLISSQLGQKANDFLRQVIHYETPNYAWEKDNFSIVEAYRDIVEEVIKKK